MTHSLAQTDSDLPGDFPPPVPTDHRTFNSYPFWSPRFWAGMRLSHWLKLLAGHGCRVDPSRLPFALLTTGAAPFNSALSQLQQLVYGRRITATQLVAPPIFVLGHWRTGTTLMQELLWHDPRLATPTNFQCYCANHFLLTERIALRYLKFLLPGKRPMDNVTLQWDSPQEDEWARVTMGLPSPYLQIAFCRDPPPFVDYENLDELPSAERTAWMDGFMRFLQAVTVSTQRRLVLKSPHHTGRLGHLHQMFPDAKFIHVTRHPFTFFPSTLRMYRSFNFSQSLQSPVQPDGLELSVLESGRRMFQSYHASRGQIPENQILDVRYAELTADPIGTMRTVYEHLNLGPVEPALEGFEKYLQPRRTYVTNRHELPAYWRTRIRREWSTYFESFGYSDDSFE
ncbi:MAG: sulfotransferase [Planctomycetaceae bacterium]